MDGVEIAYEPATDSVRVSWNPTLAGIGLARVSPQALDVSRLPGARVVATSGVANGELKAELGCVRGPSDRWAPGLEDVLFEKATWFALRGFAMEGTALRLEEGSPKNDAVISRSFRGERDGRGVRLTHALGFVGDNRDVLLCTAACAEPIAPVSRCEPVIASFALAGALETQPEPNAALRLVFAAIEEPKLSLILMIVLFVGVSAIVLRRRSRARLA